jgi:hypothetical protein
MISRAFCGISFARETSRPLVASLKYSATASLAIATTVVRSGNRSVSHSAVPMNGADSRDTSLRRLPGSTARTGLSAGRPRLARAAALSTVMGIMSASGWPTNFALTPCAS